MHDFAFVCTYIHVDAHACMYVDNMYMYIYLYTRVNADLYIYIYNVYIHMCEYISICLALWKYLLHLRPAVSQPEHRSRSAAQNFASQGQNSH